MQLTKRSVLLSVETLAFISFRCPTKQACVQQNQLGFCCLVYDTCRKRRRFDYILFLQHLVVEKHEDDGRFVYALPKNRKQRCAVYNPYELQVVSREEARACEVCWLGSASFVTMVGKTHCLQRNNNRQIVVFAFETSVIWANKCPSVILYTQVTRNQRSEMCAMTPTMEWLWERKLFSTLRSRYLFVKFR